MNSISDSLAASDFLAARDERQQREWKFRAEQDAYVESVTSGRNPLVTAATAAGELLVSEIDGAVRPGIARGGYGVAVGGIGDGGKMQFAGEDGAGECRVEGS